MFAMKLFSRIQIGARVMQSFYTRSEMSWIQVFQLSKSFCLDALFQSSLVLARLSNLAVLRRLNTAFLVAFLCAFAGIAHGQEIPELTLQELRAKYAQEASRFIDIDGVNVHYIDEGSGPAIVFLHASYLNLDSWNGLADVLAKDYRVIRFDFPSIGLSSFETKPVPEERFDLIERNYEILAGLVEALGVKSFVLVGTSSGGSVAYRYAARHPESVNRLVLINSAGLPRTPQTDPLRERMEFARWENMRVKPREFWELAFSKNFIAPNTPPEWLMDRVFDLARKKDAGEIQRKTYRFQTGDVRSVLTEIHAPTLIMWGLENPTVMHLEADVLQHWMTGAPTLLRKLPGLGHYPYIEDQDAFLPDFMAFLEGRLDNQLRYTVRLPVACPCATDAGDARSPGQEAR